MDEVPVEQRQRERDAFIQRFGCFGLPGPAMQRVTKELFENFPDFVPEDWERDSTG